MNLAHIICFFADSLALQRGPAVIKFYKAMVPCVGGWGIRATSWCYCALILCVYRFFLCVARTPDGVLRSGWAAPGSHELLRLSAVKAKLAALCMFGGPDSPSPEVLTNTFLQHRDNVSLLLQSNIPRDVHAPDEGDSAKCEGAGEEKQQEGAAGRSLALLLAGSDETDQASSLNLIYKSHQHDDTQGPGFTTSRAPLQLASNAESVRDKNERMRVEIPSAQRCGHYACMCQTDCVAVHEVEPVLPDG